MLLAARAGPYKPMKTEVLKGHGDSANGDAGRGLPSLPPSHPPPLPAPQRKVTLGLRDLRVFFPRFPWASMARGVRGAGSLGEAEVQEDTQAILRPSLTLALCASPIARAPRCARGWPREKALPSDLSAQPHLRGAHLVFAHQLGSDLMLLAGVPMVACLTPNPLPWGGLSLCFPAT